jgi:hypothetical protein
MSSMFPPKQIDDPFGAVVSKAGLKQLRCAETEKCAASVLSCVCVLLCLSVRACDCVRVCVCVCCCA